MIANSPLPAVGIVCFDDAGRVLLIRRGNPPRMGDWSIPGGKLEWGETLVDAALRELQEETGIHAEILGLIDVMDGIFSSRTTGVVHSHYVLVDYVAAYRAGDLLAGDDAAEARFVSLDQLADYRLWSSTIEVIHKGYKIWGQTLRMIQADDPGR
jgi:8-oxo-dGTP diphosphatase